MPIAVPTTPTSPAAAILRGSGRRNAIIAAAMAAISNATPPRPSGQPITAYGAPAQNRATPVIQPTAKPAGTTIARATGKAIGATMAANTPSSVAGPTAGAANRLAGIATRLTPAPRLASTGAQAA